MEDLGDETLAQISTPKKKARQAGRGSCLSSQAPEGSSLKATAPSRAAADDSEILKRPKGQNEETREEEDGATRRMFDKRELRRRHREVFDQQLAAWRAQRLHEQTPQSATADSGGSRVRVCVRKRPLFGYEREADEFDVVSVRGQSEVVVHNCLTKADLRSLFISHMGFRFARAFGDAATDDEVYLQCAAPAVQHVVHGGVATLFMFGQTGSGKTHTMAGLISRAASQLFGGDENGPDEEEQRPCLSLTAFEIAGRSMRDLLDTSGSPKELKVMEDKEHRTHVLGVKSCDVAGAQELLELVRQAQAHRATRATQVNETSSRSHAVYRIWYAAATGGAGGAEAGAGGGRSPAPAVLTLVDCAGSERNQDTSHHDSQSRKDAAEINSTIFALKECFRVMRSAKGQQPPYRESLLTRVLSDSFASERAMIVAVGTVSPSATDTEHSIGTLRALQQLQGTQMAFETREDVAKPRSTEPHPRNWSEEEVKHWFEEAVGGRARQHTGSVTKGTDGKNLVRWPVQRFTQLCGGDEDLGTRLYQDLRQRIRGPGAAAS